MFNDYYYYLLFLIKLKYCIYKIENNIPVVHSFKIVIIYNKSYLSIRGSHLHSIYYYRIMTSG